jgi:uncharacterized protein (DUF1697 family)
MPTFVALLRGVNVGKANRVSMPEFSALLSGLGYTGVATLLNSGNATFDSPGGPPEKHAAAISLALRARLEIDVAVVVKSARELADIVDQNPIPIEADTHSRLLVAFVQDTEALPELAVLARLVEPPERFEIGAQAVYLFCARGIRECRAVAALQGGAGKTATTRNLATILKLRELAGT